MSNLQTKIELEVLRTKICINHQNVEDELWLTSNTPHMHEHYEKELSNDIETYLETLRPLLVPNKTYVMDMHNPVLPYDDENNIVKFMYDDMVYGEYESYGDNYFYDKSKPAKIHKYCDAGRGTMSENKSEIIECLHCSPFTFLVDDDGNTIINGRPYDIHQYLVSYLDKDKINVKVAKNIFDTDLIANISLFTI